MPNSESFPNYYTTWLFWRIWHGDYLFLETFFPWLSFLSITSYLPSFPLPLLYMTLPLPGFFPHPILSFIKKKPPPIFHGSTKMSSLLYAYTPRLRLNLVICSSVFLWHSLYTCIKAIITLHINHSYTCLSLLNCKIPWDLHLNFIHFCIPSTNSEAT